MFKMTRYLIFTVFFVVHTATALAANSVLTIVRSVGSGADKSTALVGYHFNTLNNEDANFKSIDLVKALGTVGKEPHDFAAAQELVNKGSASYEGLDLDAAIQYFEYALGRYQRDVAYVSGTKEMSNVLLLLAAAHILRGDEKLGTDRLAQALELNPKAEPDPRIYNPAMRKIFDDVSTRVQKRGVGKIVINSTPSYAEVYIDGNFKGITPFTAEDVVQGQHLVQVRKPGYEPAGALVTVQAKAEVPYSAALKQLANFSTYDALTTKAVAASTQNPRKVDSSMLELGQLTGADYLLVSRVHIEGDKVQVDGSLYDLKKEKRLGTDTTIFAFSTKPENYRVEIQALYEKLKKGVVSEEKIVPPTVVTKPAPGFETTTKKPCTGFFCSTYNVTAVSLMAGGLALAGGGSAFWYLAKSKNDSYKDTPQIADEAADLKSQGQTYALLGDIMVFAGGAALLSGAIMLVVPLFHKSPPAKAQLEDPTSFHVAATALPGGGLLNASMRF